MATRRHRSHPHRTTTHSSIGNPAAFDDPDVDDWQGRIHKPVHLTHHATGGIVVELVQPPRHIRDDHQWARQTVSRLGTLEEGLFRQGPRVWAVLGAHSMAWTASLCARAV